MTSIGLICSWRRALLIVNEDLPPWHSKYAGIHGGSSFCANLTSPSSICQDSLAYLICALQPIVLFGCFRTQYRPFPPEPRSCQVHLSPVDRYPANLTHSIPSQEALPGLRGPGRHHRPVSACLLFPGSERDCQRTVYLPLSGSREHTNRSAAAEGYE